MQSLRFQILLNASKEKVWNSLWEDANYRAWTSAFAEGSCAESDWKKGSKILFTDGKGSGMVSVIEEMIPNDFMSFRHDGMVKDGVEDMEIGKTQGWAGSHENYTLKEVNGETELTVEMEGLGMSTEMLDYFNDAWPKALAKLKEIAEKG
jgi:uncharacterized protein YndB with AHSA1/START domain